VKGYSVSDSIGQIGVVVTLAAATARVYDIKVPWFDIQKQVATKGAKK
jgi:hypothetical protein